MAYLAVRKFKTKLGVKWIATRLEWNATKKKYDETKLTPTVMHDLGFRDDMSADAASKHVKNLNARSADERKMQSKKAKASENLHHLALVKNSIVPDEMSEAFVKHIKQNWYGGDYNLRKMIQHWNLVQRIVTELNLQPHEYFKSQRQIYKHFEQLEFSKSYVEKLLKVLNAWGEFYSEEKQTFFKKVPNPKGIVLEAIIEASDADGAGADPLNEKTLAKLKLVLPAGQYEYMRACLWLGLRPSELDQVLADPSKMKTHIQGQTPIASVYQAKLNAVAKSKRWKLIPCFHAEMVAAVKDIEAGVPKKPLVKTLRKAVPELPAIGLYSGRKGFADLMLAYGQTLENIAAWLGHSSIERTWKHYKNKSNVVFNEIA